MEVILLSITILLISIYCVFSRRIIIRRSAEIMLFGFGNYTKNRLRQSTKGGISLSKNLNSARKAGVSDNFFDRIHFGQKTLLSAPVCELSASPTMSARRADVSAATWMSQSRSQKAAWTPPQKLRRGKLVPTGLFRRFQTAFGQSVKGGIFLFAWI
ncbi:MAG: hypothetical protein E7485_04035 [Ruminococcaceae bacterium]|nr:hypothetical protein [Oscillospiraceae bacterium]